MDLPTLHSLRSLGRATHLEALLARREVNGSNVHDLLVLAVGVVAEEREGLDEARGRNVDGELVLVYRELLDVLGQTSGEVLPVLVQRGVDLGGNLGGVDADRLFEGGLRRLRLG